MDGERGRRLRLAHHVLRHAGVGAHVGRGQTADLQRVVLADLVPKGPCRRLKSFAGRRLTSLRDEGLRGRAYLPLGRSPSSFLQRTVGTGSPRASHLNSTLWSTSTTWLTGRCTKLGRSASVQGTKTSANVCCLFIEDLNSTHEEQHHDLGVSLHLTERNLYPLSRDNCESKILNNCNLGWLIN